MKEIMQVFDIQECQDREFKSWAMDFLLETATYAHGNDSYIRVYVSLDPENEDCIFHPNRHYKTKPTDIPNLLKLKEWMESEGLEYLPYPNDEVLIRIWW